MESTTILNNVEERHIEELDTVTIRFAGDSGDGMQLTGTKFTNTSAIAFDRRLRPPSRLGPTPRSVHPCSNPACSWATASCTRSTAY